LRVRKVRHQIIFQQITTKLYTALMCYFVQRALADKCRAHMKYLAGEGQKILEEILLQATLSTKHFIFGTGSEVPCFSSAGHASFLSHFFTNSPPIVTRLCVGTKIFIPYQCYTYLLSQYCHRLTINRQVSLSTISVQRRFLTGYNFHLTPTQRYFQNLFFESGKTIQNTSNTLLI
jgi:hypothetical protein